MIESNSGSIIVLSTKIMIMDKISKVRNTLMWITEILNKMNIPYQVTGGLAAKCYGSTRDLHDIDIYVPNESISKLEQRLDRYLKFGLEHYRDENWDIVFMKLHYNGQQIEFGDADSAKYFDSQSQEWIKEEIIFEKSVLIEFEGIELAVMPKQQLIDYKQKLNRSVDQMDIKEIQKDNQITS